MMAPPPESRTHGRRRRLVAGVDLMVVAGQLGRRPHPMSRVVRRCPYGYPAVVETLPYDAAGQPFPTLFYTTCPTLVAAIGALESAGGVRRFAARLESEADLRRSLAAAVRYVRRRRQALVAADGLPWRDGGSSLRTGIGGVADAGTVKCLHAHAALALARSGYHLGDEVLAEAGEIWCGDRRCARWLVRMRPAGRLGGAGERWTDPIRPS
jgi:uncharacterized protein